MQSLTKQFADWVATKPRDEVYDCCDSRVCAFTQFCQAHGYDSPPNRFWELPGAARQAILGPNGGARMQTFGALADRLSA